MKKEKIYFGVIVIMFLVNMLLLFTRYRAEYDPVSRDGSNSEANLINPEIFSDILLSSLSMTGQELEFVNMFDEHGQVLDLELRDDNRGEVIVYLSSYSCSQCVDELLKRLFKDFPYLIQSGLTIISESWNIRQYIITAKTYAPNSTIKFIEGHLKNPDVITDKPVLIRIAGKEIIKAVVYDDSMKHLLPIIINSLED